MIPGREPLARGQERDYLNCITHFLIPLPHGGESGRTPCVGVFLPGGSFTQLEDVGEFLEEQDRVLRCRV